MRSPTSIPTETQPAGLAATPSAVYVASPSGLLINPIGGSPSTQPGATSAVAALPGPNGDLVAYGTGAKKVVLASVSGGSVKLEAEFEDNKGEVFALAFSPDGKLLAAGDVSHPTGGN
jgi:WD40 repeat protein